MKKKIIIINYTGKRGGGSVVSIESAKAFLNNGYSLIAIVSSFAENLNEWKQLDLVDLFILKTYNNFIDFIFRTLFFTIFGTNKIHNLKKKYANTDFIYCPMVSFWTYQINKKLGFKYYVVNHDPIPHSGENIFHKIYDKVFKSYKVYSNSEAVIVHSETFKTYVETKFNKKVFYIPLGEHSTYLKEELIVESLYDSKKINFLFFGRITKYKGLNILYEAFKIISTKYPNEVFLNIVGEGNANLYLDNDYKKFPIELVNKWIPDDEVMKYFIGKNLILVCPYIDATQSGVILVSYSFGVPVIATKTGGLNEQVRDTYTGFLIEPNNLSELVDKMEKFILEPTIIDEMQKNILSNNSTRSWDKIIEKFLIDIYIK